MSLDSPLAAGSGPEVPPSSTVQAAPPGVIALSLAFAKMSLAGFGGVLPFARRAIVDEHRWMTADEFNETFALCHFLPGPNIVNLTFVFGSRFRGFAGAVAAFLGLDRKSTRLNSSHVEISYAVFCLKKKKKKIIKI